MQHEPRIIGTGHDRAGYVDVGSGVPVVLVHGGGAGADWKSNFEPAIPHLAEDRHVVAVDMLGFGASAAPDPSGFDYSQPARTKHMRTFLENLDIGPAHLVGNSMGGATCLGVALEAPHLVRSLTLMASAGRSGHDAITSNPALAPLLNYDGTEAGMRALLGALTHDYQPPDELVAYRVAQSIRPELQAAYRATMGWVRTNGLWFDERELQSLGVPTHVLHGRHDDVVPLDTAIEIFELISTASLTVMGELGHLVMIENPPLFCTTVRAFWDDLDARAEPAT